MSLFEGTNINLKGWIHGRKRKLILWKPKSHIRPYHTEHVANNPKSYGMTEHDLLKIIAKGMDGFEPEDDETKDIFQDIKVGRFDRSDEIDDHMYSQGWVRVVLNKGTSSIEAPRAYNRNILPAAKVLAKRFSWAQIEFLEIGDILNDDVPELISDEGSWKTYLKTGKIPKKTEIGSTMAMFREWTQLNEGKFGHTLWIDPKGKIYDMNDRKEITDPKGHPYTHYDWVAANFTKYFGKTAPDNMGNVVYDAPHEKGWARIRNNSREIDVEVNVRKLTRSQKKALRDIVDAGPEYGNKGINRPMYIDAWVKNKKSRAGDKAYNNYEEIVDFLSEGINECWDTHVQKGYKMKGGKRVPNCVPRNEEVDEVYKDSGLGKWFGQSAGGEPGWDRYNTKGDRVGKCGDSKPGEGKPKCLSPEKARKLKAQGGKKAIANAAKRKKSQDPDTDRPGTGNKPINVSNKIKKEETVKSFNQYLEEKNKPTNPKLWASSIAAAKSKFDVYPSAYANAWASKHYKSKGGGWTKSESVEEGCGCNGTSEEASPAWTRKAGKNKEGGLNAAGRKSYERENPGSDLKAPVSSKTASKNPDGKAAKRRKSFCARMGGMPGPMKDEKGKPTRKALALRKWDC